MTNDVYLARLRAAVAHETWDRLKESIPHTQIPMSVVEAIAVTAQVVAAEWASYGDLGANGAIAPAAPSTMAEGKDDEAFRRHVISGSLHALIISVSAMYAVGRVESVRKIQDCVAYYAKHQEDE